jgi:hypothetical protein
MGCDGKASEWPAVRSDKWRILTAKRLPGEISRQAAEQTHVDELLLVAATGTDFDGRLAAITSAGICIPKPP